MRPMLTVLLTITHGALVSGQTNATKSATPSVEQILMQLERDWNRATLSKDYKTLERIMADDWIGIDYRGYTATKAESIGELKSGESSNKSVELGAIKVKVFGNTAVVMGSDIETSTDHGKDSSGKYGWMDVFVKRNGRWQAAA
jgi:ketosteroid isomerase-like protein